MYEYDIGDDLKRTLKKLCKKNRQIYQRIIDKMQDILENPQRYKHLGHDMKGECRVHIGSYVLTFEINENEKMVVFLDYDHHDNIYKKRKFKLI
ncbi:MAG: addiction module toxin RelE [Candidatus Altiarchaeales archaeon HGW-Altiarchaeales-1]|nr:MAG: addiction module toxin RelE [Candidatus Altiarchaeales archaeon HGW-Altiarchaeales-1]PKP59706.1 MAG: addiction module toxin RelE [Candidatus Altiarchaeales archaeon HGW-Altiarchaeales-2]